MYRIGLLTFMMTRGRVVINVARSFDPFNSCTIKQRDSDCDVKYVVILNLTYQ